jgi:hypothetical protein
LTVSVTATRVPNAMASFGTILRLLSARIGLPSQDSS